MAQKSESQVDRKDLEIFVPDQVMLTGPVDRIKGLVEEPEVELEPAGTEEGDRWSLQLGDTRGVLSTCENLGTMLPELGDCPDQEWVMQLFRIVDGTPVPKAVELLRGRGRQHCVHADANLLTGYPYTVAGSPYTVAGSPYTVAGSGLSKLGDPATSSDFWSQWALEQIGRVGETAATTKYTGQRVRVGVFDTSPFDWGDSRPSAGITVTSSTLAEAQIDWVDPAMALTVQHPTVYDLYPLPAPPVPAAAAGVTPEPLPDLSDHGLSAAGLVYAVAEGCDIYLYRVLDQYARGNLFVLISALLEFTSSTVSPQSEAKGGVISLSLGIPQSQALGKHGLPQDVLALNIVLALAHCQGLVVVAASGNGSSLNNIAEPEIPAALPFVIGVAASNYDRNRACFSNRGDVAAPGGDGYRGLPGCLRKLFGQQGQAGCEDPWKRSRRDRWKYGLLAPVLKARDKTGYARWAGTSFATPLVSGLAARILDKEGGWVPPKDVAVTIESSAVSMAGSDLPTGIISVTGSLQP